MPLYKMMCQFGFFSVTLSDTSYF